MLLLLVTAATGAAGAGEVRVAVASNFAPVLARLQPHFEAESPHRIAVVSAASTGKLYAQIRHGAPYDVLLAADQRRPERLEARGLAVSGSRFTYATGRLVLFGAVTPDAYRADAAALLREDTFRRLAIANPRLAPYGAAAEQAMARLSVLDRLRSRLVFAENIGQAFALVSTGNAELGFVAASQVATAGTVPTGHCWAIPPALHDPIRQDAVLLRRGDRPAPRAFLAWLRSPEARAVISAAGYAPAGETDARPGNAPAMQGERSDSGDAQVLPPYDSAGCRPPSAPK